MSRSSQGETPFTFHEFEYAKMPIDQFYNHLTKVYVINEGLTRAEAYYVSELRVLKEPSKTCHEYTIAVIKRTDGKDEVNYLAFERSIGKQLQSEDDLHSPHPNRALERRIFMERQEVPDSDNEDVQGGLRPGLALVDRAMASTTSLDSLRKKAVLADDRVLVLNRPYCQKNDKTVAVLRLQPPPNAVIPPESSTSSSTPTISRFRSRKLSNPPREQSQPLHRTTSGPSAISNVPRDPTVSSTTPSIVETSPSSAVPATPTTPRASSKPTKRKWIYRVYSKNCYWFAGMLIQVARMFTYIEMEVHEGNSVSHLQPGEETLSWYNDQMGKWMNVIRVVKTPMNSTLEALVDEFWTQKLKFEEGVSWILKLMASVLSTREQVVRQRLQHTREAREREKRKEEELRRAREERRKGEEELRKAREDTEIERRKREEELGKVRAAGEEELKKVQEAKEEELKRVQEAKEEELKRVREEERGKNEEELRRVQEAKEEELKRVREEERGKNEEERRRNEEELQRVRSEQEKDRKARGEAEQRMKLLLEYVKAGNAPPPELLAEIAKTPQV